MNPVRTGSIAILLALSPLTSPALPSSSNASLARLSLPAPYPASVVYRNIGSENQPASDTAANPPNSFEGTESDKGGFLANIKRNRVDNLSMGIQRTDWCLSNDHASLNVYAPTEAMNHLLTVAKALPSSPLDDLQAAVVQTLFLLGKQQINTELSYTVKVNNHSNFDSSIVYRLNPDAGKPDVVASMRYSGKF